MVERRQVLIGLLEEKYMLEANAIAEVVFLETHSEFPNEEEKNKTEFKAHVMRIYQMIRTERFGAGGGMTQKYAVPPPRGGGGGEGGEAMTEEEEAVWEDGFRRRLAGLRPEGPEHSRSDGGGGGNAPPPAAAAGAEAVNDQFTPEEEAELEDFLQQGDSSDGDNDVSFDALVTAADEEAAAAAQNPDVHTVDNLLAQPVGQPVMDDEEAAAALAALNANNNLEGGRRKTRRKQRRRKRRRSRKK